MLGAGRAQLLHPRDSMAKVKLGREEFDVDSEEVHAFDCGATDAGCVALAARMKSGEMYRLKRLYLVRLFLVVFPPSPPLIRIISQGNNEIGDVGARAIADAMRRAAITHGTATHDDKIFQINSKCQSDAIRTNSSVQTLDLVRICCR